MAEKHYSNDWAKSKSRDMVRDLVKRTLLTFRRPKDLRVLCFPGIDAQEIFEVYDPLGIPRGNIVGLERDKEIAAEIQRKNLGIEVVPMSDLEYAEQSRSINFDVISLDYVGPLNDSELGVLKQLRKKQTKNHFVLHLANLLRRDHNSNEFYRLGYIHTKETDTREGFTLGDSADLKIKEFVDKVEKIAQQLEAGKSIAEEKRVGYSTIIQSSFIGLNSEIMDQFTRFVYGIHYNRYVQDMLSIINKKSPITINSLQDISKLPCSNEIAHFIMTENVNRAIKMAKHVGVHPELQENFVGALINNMRERKFFVPKEAEFYSYVSESGSPMIGDIYFLSYPERKANKAAEVAQYVGYPTNFGFNDLNKLNFLVWEFLNESRKFSDTTKREVLNSHNRIFLGSSSRPVLTKGRAIEELSSGISIEQIQQKYRGWENKPLAQWKAHVTMGTYAKQQIEETISIDQPIQIDESDSGLERITKEDAIDLLSSGIPPKEIYEAFPTSFSKGQLGAFKAHINMGTYN